MPFKEGREKTGGRKKGTPNKFSNLKEAFLRVFDELGGWQGLFDWAKRSPRNKTEFYKIIAKMLPAHLDLPDDSNIVNIILNGIEKLPWKQENDKQK